MAVMWITAGSGQEVAAPVRTWILENFHTKSAMVQFPPLFPGEVIPVDVQWRLLAAASAPDHLSLSPEVEQAVQKLRKLDECQKTKTRRASSSN